MKLSDLSRAIQAARILPPRHEAELQERLWEIFAPMGLLREHEIAKGQRPDFYHKEHKLAVEVKTAGSTADLERQLLRYVLRADTEGVLVVTTKAMHLHCSTSLTRGGKAIPVNVLLLSGL